MEQVVISKPVKLDLVCFCLISLPVPLLVLVYGDALYIGLWYYLVIPACALGLGLWLCRRPGYLAGVAIALALEYLIYLQYNWFATERREGMIGIVHLYSMPGVLLGMVFIARVFEQWAPRSAFAVMLLSCFSVLWWCTFLVGAFYLLLGELLPWVFALLS